VKFIHSYAEKLVYSELVKKKKSARKEITTIKRRRHTHRYNFEIGRKIKIDTTLQ